MTAVDRGILEEKDELEGIFVVVLDGDSYDEISSIQSDSEAEYDGIRKNEWFEP